MDTTASNPRIPRQGWTLVLLSVGIGLISCCVLIPQAEENRKLHWETEKLRGDLAHMHRQIEANSQFLARVGEDPALAERLAQRQMKFIRKGTSVLELKDSEPPARSPFLLTVVPSPPPMPQYRPLPGKVAEVCREPRSRLYTIGAGLMLLAIGLVLGHSPR